MSKKQNVTITLKQLIGYMKNESFNYLVFILIFMCFSCSTLKPYKKDNYFLSRVDYYNAPLSINAIFPGDMDYYDDKVKKVERKKIKPYKQKNILLHGEALNDYELYLFYNKNKNIRTQKDTLLINDSINQKVVYTKSEQGREVILMLKSLGKEKSNRKLLRDGEAIINSMNFNDSIKNNLNYMEILFKNKNESNFLNIVDKIDKAPIEKNKKNEWDKFQLLITLLSNDASNERYINLLKKIEDKTKEGYQKEVDSILKVKTIFLNESAINKIKDLSKSTNVVMLNECHWCPKHRIMAQKLLKPLKEAGYCYLAIEALEKGADSILNSGKYPTKESGYYTREPFFGLFIRMAIDLGFTIVGYDFDHVYNNREKGQAENIKKIIDNNKDAKVFVYAGIDHVLESNKANKRMAEYFKELTNIDPLTIDQVEIVNEEENETILVESKYFDNIENINTSVDYFLINNIQPNINKIFGDEKIKKVTFKEEILNSYIGQDVLISVYYSDEYENYRFSSIPIINKIYTVKSNIITLDLPINYKVRVKIMDVKNNNIISSSIDM